MSTENTYLAEQPVPAIESLRALVIRRYRVVVFLLVIVVMALKGPDLLLHPRVWAEEVYYLNFSLNNGLWSSLVHSTPSLGYYLLTANVPSVLSAQVSKSIGLEYAPVVTTYFSFLVQLVPFLVLLYGTSRLFTTPKMAAMACALILFAPTSSGEIWFTSIHTKNWTGLTVFLLLFEDMTAWTSRRKWFFRLVVLLCGLSGPYSVIVFPLFVVAYWVYGERERLVYAGLLASCFLLDVLVSIAETRAGNMGLRTTDFTFDSAVVNVFVYQILDSILGTHSIPFARHYLGMEDVIYAAIAVPRGSRVLWAAVLCGLATLGLLKLFWWKLRSPQTLLAASFVVFAAFTAVTALWGLPHNRYAFLPGLAFLLLPFSAFNGAKPWRRVVAVAVLGCSLYSGIRDYPKFWIEMSGGQPAWPNEVKKWREDPSYKPLVWPDWFGGHLEWRPEGR